MSNKFFAVLTGDIVGYSKTKGARQEKLLNSLKNVFKEIEQESGKPKNQNHFGIFRGDSFQGLVTDPGKALLYALKIKSSLRSFVLPGINFLFDARIAIGIGRVDSIKKNIAESDGEAFRLSGPALDEMSSQNRLKIRTPYLNINDEFDLICFFMDVIINKWTRAQSEVVFHLLNGLNQTTIAEKLNVSQAAINQRIMSANWYVIDSAITRFETLIIEKVIK